MQWIIVGLGNPDAEYAGTRHNIGRDMLHALAATHKLGEWKTDKKLRALTLKAKLFEKDVTLVCPETSMNRSGLSLEPLVRSKKQAEMLVVVHDELDLPLGRTKMSFGSGPGGHNGVGHIQKVLKTKDFVRVRVGISGATPKGKLKKPDGAKVVDFVLGTFSKKEKEALVAVQKNFETGLELLLTQGRPQATTFVNSQ